MAPHNPENPPAESRNLIIGATGASGSLYLRHFLKALTEHTRGESALILTEASLQVYREEVDAPVSSRQEMFEHLRSSLDLPSHHTLHLYSPNEVGARPASGSAPYQGMVVVPCSMKTLASISHGIAGNLLERAADVTLKERRPLVVVPRETPYNLIHLRNMTALTEAGGVVLPASPAFYQRPESLDDLGRFMAGRILSLLGIRQQLYRPWEGSGTTPF